MNLDGLFREAEIEGDLLVEEPGCDRGKHLALARCHSPVAPLESDQFVARRLQCAATLRGAMDRSQQCLVVNWLLQKVYGATLHSFDAHRNAGVPGDEHHREM